MVVQVLILNSILHPSPRHQSTTNLLCAIQSVVGKGWDHHIRGRVNYRDVGFSCTAELEKPKGKGVACTLSYVQALTHKYQCGGSSN